VFDTFTILGKSALTETIAMRPRTDVDYNDLGRVKITGMSMTYGYQNTEFDADTASASTRLAQNSGVLACYSGTMTM
jgi:hypothetical protein